VAGVPAETIARCDGVLAGTSKIAGVDVAIFAQEPSYKGGSMGLKHTRRLQKLAAAAVAKKVPLVGLYESGGARVRRAGAPWRR
jgi:acetyl-CoA carboxylase beta subunit